MSSNPLLLSHRTAAAPNRAGTSAEILFYFLEKETYSVAERSFLPPGTSQNAQRPLGGLQGRVKNPRGILQFPLTLRHRENSCHRFGKSEAIGVSWCVDIVYG